MWQGECDVLVNLTPSVARRGRRAARIAETRFRPADPDATPEESGIAPTAAADSL